MKPLAISSFWGYLIAGNNLSNSSLSSKFATDKGKKPRPGTAKPEKGENEMYRKTTKKRLLLFAAPAWAVGLACLLSGCIALPGQEPFGEKTYPVEQAQAVYEKLSADMEQQEFMDQNGYTIRILPFVRNNDVSDFMYDICKTAEYTVFAAEGACEDYLWYKDRLYCGYYDDNPITYRDMAWEDLKFEAYAAERWSIARQLLERDDPELTYKYIPMSSPPYLLKAAYPDIELSDGREIRFAELYFYMDENGKYDGFGLSWQEDRRQNVSISYFPYEGSTSLQAERRIWSFGYDAGLTDEGVPALSDQSEDRERCRALISGMDFDALAERSEYREDLCVPPMTP